MQSFGVFFIFSWSYSTLFFRNPDLVQVPIYLTYNCLNYDCLKFLDTIFTYFLSRYLINMKYVPGTFKVSSGEQ
jgi:hypothetical protein